MHGTFQRQCQEALQTATVAQERFDLVQGDTQHIPTSEVLIHLMRSIVDYVKHPCNRDSELEEV
eukprot:8706803-Alexandrium_andersonii.AAC.1